VEASSRQLARRAFIAIRRGECRYLGLDHVERLAYCSLITAAANADDRATDAPAQRGRSLDHDAENRLPSLLTTRQVTLN
jgi:hypothetical protein